jgi:hypothetical protein
MIIYSADRSTLMEVEEFSREGSCLKFSGKIMGAMPVTAVVTPSQIRALIKALGVSLILFAISMLFRRDP